MRDRADTGLPACSTGSGNCKGRRPRYEGRAACAREHPPARSSKEVESSGPSADRLGYGLEHSRCGNRDDFAVPRDAIAAANERIAVRVGAVVIEHEPLAQGVWIFALEIVDARVRGIAGERAIVSDELSV